MDSSKIKEEEPENCQMLEDTDVSLFSFPDSVCEGATPFPFLAQFVSHLWFLQVGQSSPLR